MEPSSTALRGFGEPAPMFVAPCGDIPRFNFSSAAGRWIVLAFHGSLSFPASAEGLRVMMQNRELFDDANTAFFSVSVDQADKNERGLQNLASGVRYFWDFDMAISRLYGIARDGAYTPTAFLLDPALRIVASEPIARVGRLFDLMTQMRRDTQQEWEGMTAPVLVTPRIFEPEFCAELLAHYNEKGGTPSGVMREREGMTVGVLDDNFKRRRDVFIEDEELHARARRRLEDRLLPMVRRAYGWEATRIERYLIACYDSANRGMFMPHRDNTTSATAHRKFAVTINLNDGYEGGALRFPEFGPRTYKPPAGGAVVFGCSLLHEATPVESGVRYAFVPFLYDEAGAALRDANKHLLAGQGQATQPPPQPVG